MYRTEPPLADAERQKARATRRASAARAVSSAITAAGGAAWLK
jgi:hypothetical protein